MRILFLFFDGIGLGLDDTDNNPFSAADLPTLTSLTNGKRLLNGLTRQETARSVFIPTDPNLGVEGKPQSASGQAAIMTGINVPQEIGRHYGPKPDKEIAGIIRKESVVSKIVKAGKTASLLNVYPSKYLESVESGKRLLSSNQLALNVAGVRLRDGSDYFKQEAMSVDFTGEMWRDYGSHHDAQVAVWRTSHTENDLPILTPTEAGQQLGKLALQHDFTFFDHWLTDYLGHRGTLEQAIQLLEQIDAVLAGLLESWNDKEGVIIITSDHGNLEDIAARGHTRNLVPTFIIGDKRNAIMNDRNDLTAFASGIMNVMLDTSNH